MGNVECKLKNVTSLIQAFVIRNIQFYIIHFSVVVGLYIIHLLWLDAQHAADDGLTGV